MTKRLSARVVLAGAFLLAWTQAVLVAKAGSAVDLWLTHPKGAARFEKQPGARAFTTGVPANPAIAVDPATRFQPVDGFGYSLTGGSATHLLGMSPAARAAALAELFGSGGTNIGVSVLRITIGASDLDERAYSYDDLPVGATDPELKQFNLGPDLTNVVPVLKQILAVEPHVKLMGSPWSAPVWMKTKPDFRGGSLRKDCFGVYARYLVKYIEAMKAQGIELEFITVQNEPLHPGNNPSMYMSANDQAEFIREHLGPAFEKAGLKTKIVCYDHNADRPDYPLTVLNDPGAKRFVDGSAFHLYGGKIEAVSQVHDAHPDRNLYFTEQWIGAPGNLPGDLAWHTSQLIIGATRNWCRTVLEWNLSSAPDLRPHTDRGGCDRCLGAITIDGDRITRNPAYYIIAHASKFVRPGSVRVASTASTQLPNVAFLTPSGQKVLIVLNREGNEASFKIGAPEGSLDVTLPGGAVGTFVW